MIPFGNHAAETVIINRRVRAVLAAVLAAGILWCLAGEPLEAEASLNVMEDGTLFDADWYRLQLKDAGITGIGSTETELYRHYQLYGQGDGLTGYNAASWGREVLEHKEERALALQESLKEEWGSGWLTILAAVCDTEDVAYWNMSGDTEISQETVQALSDAIFRFVDKGYSIGFVLVDINTGAAVSYRAGVEVYSASVIKGPYIFSLLESGIGPTNDMYLAGNQSDNDAYRRLRTTYGNDVFSDWLSGTNIPDAQSRTRYITTTPLDLCRMFYKGSRLLLGEEEYSDWARDTFTDSLNSAAALTIGSEKTVYSKAGWIAGSGTYHSSSYTNAAVVDGEYPYIVAVMSNSPGYAGLTLAQELMSVLDAVHGEMVQ